MNKIRLTYHWSELWRTLLSLMRFLTTYATDLSTNPRTQTLTASLADLIAFCVSGGDTFLPDPASYDDLFYKLVETGPILAKFRHVFTSPSSSNTSASKPADAAAAAIIPTPDTQPHLASIDTLLSVSTHFYTLLFQSDGGADPTITPATAAVPEPASDSPNPDADPALVALPSIKKKNLSPREVHRIIKQGYDTLSIQPPEGLSAWAKWRESEWKGELKRGARVAVEDARMLVS
jgi:hypothetical protein